MDQGSVVGALSPFEIFNAMNTSDSLPATDPRSTATPPEIFNLGILLKPSLADPVDLGSAPRSC